MDTTDQTHIRGTIELAQQARDNGNHPFGALLVGPGGEVLLEAMNTVVTGGDVTGHAETNLVREASKKYDADFLAQCTLYTSTEPCPMCAGAIFWANIRQVVYGLSEAGLYEIAGEDGEEVLRIPSREVFDRGNKPITVVGPVLEDEARRVHEGFWQ
jgi:tRNA(Arg) A34 adenosine deaminase TadA